MNRQLLRLPAKALTASGGATSEGRQPGAARGLTLEQTITADRVAEASRALDGVAVLRAAGHYCPDWPLGSVRAALKAAGYPDHAASLGKTVLSISIEKLLTIA